MLGEETRRCVECGVVKPITEFSKNLARGNVGGRQLFCRECGKQHRVTAVRRHHAAKKAAAAPPSPPEPRKTCTRCDQSKPASDFAPYEGTIDHRDFLCSSCREKATAEKEQRAAKRERREEVVQGDYVGEGKCPRCGREDVGLYRVNGDGGTICYACVLKKSAPRRRVAAAAVGGAR